PGVQREQLLLALAHRRPLRRVGGQLRQGTLQADEFRPIRIAVVVEPVSVDQARRVVVGGFEDGVQERFVLIHRRTPYGCWRRTDFQSVVFVRRRGRIGNPSYPAYTDRRPRAGQRIVMITLSFALVAVAAYLAGAVPFGYLVPRLVRGIDVRKAGSGNVGATNVGRVMGARWGVLVFVLDFAKGAVPVAVARLLPPRFEGAPEDVLAVVAGVCAFLGHLFPVYLGFKGGKGVATAAGVVAVLVPLLTLAVFAAWAVVLLSTRFMSVASM